MKTKTSKLVKSRNVARPITNRKQNVDVELVSDWLSQHHLFYSANQSLRKRNTQAGRFESIILIVLRKIIRNVHKTFPDEPPHVVTNDQCVVGDHEVMILYWK